MKEKRIKTFCEHSIEDIKLINASEGGTKQTGMHDDYRTPFLLYTQGYTAQQIADKMNLPFVTVVNRINRALRS